MIRRTAVLSTLISALSMTVLLGACSKNEEKAAADEQQAASDSQAAEAPAAAPAPERKIDYWKVIGPLVAGSYSGKCMRMPDARQMDAAIVIGADGKASSGDLSIDFHAAKMATLMRTRDKDGQYGTQLVLSVDDGKAGTLSLASGVANKDGSASLGKDDIGLVCGNITGAEKLNAQPLFTVLGKLVDGKKQTIGCLDTKNLLVRRDTNVEVADGVVKIGDAAYDMKTATTESFIFSDSGSTLSVSIALPDERTVNISYDGAGKLIHVQGYQKQESTHFCNVQN